LEASQSGLEWRAGGGEPVARFGSVSSLFVSRIDSKIDPQLDALGSRAARQLRGRIGVASAQRAYQGFEELFSGPRGGARRRAGGRPPPPQ
jgi:transaldolase